MEKGKPELEREKLDLYTRYNDYIITRLRTMWGICLEELRESFGEELYGYCLEQAASALRLGRLRREGGRLTLSREGIFISDGIMSDLLWV